MIGRE